MPKIMIAHHSQHTHTRSHNSSPPHTRCCALISPNHPPLSPPPTTTTTTHPTHPPPPDVPTSFVPLSFPSPEHTAPTTAFACGTNSTPTTTTFFSICFRSKVLFFRVLRGVVRRVRRRRARNGARQSRLPRHATHRTHTHTQRRTVALAHILTLPPPPRPLSFDPRRAGVL